MMASTAKRTPAKGKGRTPPAGKGCSCKRSQCIKNYCDCYQSMMVCTQFCRCVGCRNTEERLAVEPRTPSRNSGATKRDWAAATGAMAAASNAMMEGFNTLQVPLVSSTSNTPQLPLPSSTSNPPLVPLLSSTSQPVNFVPVPPPMPMEPINMIRVAPDSFNDVLRQVATEPLPPPEEADELPTPPEAPEGPQFPRLVEPPGTESNGTLNLFAPMINEQALKCMLIRGTEAEEVGLDPQQVARLAIGEFSKLFKEIAEKVLEITLDE